MKNIKNRAMENSAAIAFSVNAEQKRVRTMSELGKLRKYAENRKWREYDRIISNNANWED